MKHHDTDNEVIDKLDKACLPSLDISLPSVVDPICDSISQTLPPSLPLSNTYSKKHPLSDRGEIIGSELKAQRIKRGYRELSTPLSCGVSFETDPVWLWSLRPNDWSTIFITEPDEAILRQVHPSLYSKLGSKLSILSLPLALSVHAPRADVWWISGSSWFIRSTILPSSVMKVVWLSGASRRLPIDMLDFRWSKVTHRQVGGVTRCRGTFGVSVWCPPLDLEKDLLRSLGHVVKYSMIRPQPLRLPCQIPHYTVDDHLSPLYLRRPVVYSTYMSSTGWGIRTLSDLELASCFELPDYVLWDDRFATDIVPIQMFRSIVDLIILRLSPQSPDSQKKPRHDFAGEQREITPDGVWLPQIS